MSLDELLQEIRARRLILLQGSRGRVLLWSPNTRVPLAVRQAIRRYNRELARMIARSEIYVCPNADLHRKSWDYELRRYCCNVCARLVKEVS